MFMSEKLYPWITTGEWVEQIWYHENWQESRDPRDRCAYVRASVCVCVWMHVAKYAGKEIQVQMRK